MQAVEFTAELQGTDVLKIPEAAMAQLPKAGTVRVIVLSQDSTEDAAWQAGAYQQFLREDPPEDSIYQTLR